MFPSVLIDLFTFQEFMTTRQDHAPVDGRATRAFSARGNAPSSAEERRGTENEH